MFLVFLEEPTEYFPLSTYPNRPSYILALSYLCILFHLTHFGIRLYLRRTSPSPSAAAAAKTERLCARVKSRVTKLFAGATEQVRHRGLDVVFVCGRRGWEA